MDHQRALRAGRIPLYDIARVRVICMVTPSELNHRAAQGTIGWFRNHKGKLHACVQPVPMQSRASDSIHSKIPLVQTDMELNVEGLVDGSRKFGLNRYGAVDDQIIGNRVDQSMSKVEAWPEIYDDKNVVVCAGQVHGVRQVSPEQLAAL